MSFKLKFVQETALYGGGLENGVNSFKYLLSCHAFFYVFIIV